MPNYCNYEMKIKGSKRAIQRVVDCLKADYNYDHGKPAHKHFFRVFDVYENEMEKNEDGTYTLFVCGDCAWSVHSAMVSKTGESYYSYLKKNFPQDFMGTTLFEQSKNCEIEVFSEEPGCEFSEHYLFKNGVCLIDDCVDITASFGYNEKGELTKNIDWDTYDDEVVYDNPHREAPNDIYRWTI